MAGVILTVGNRSVRVRAMMPDEDPGAFHGFYDPDPFEIGINTADPAYRQAETLIHEAIHAIWDGLDMGTRAAEETVATKIGHGLAALLRDNPALLIALTGAIHYNVPIVKTQKGE